MIIKMEAVMQNRPLLLMKQAAICALWSRTSFSAPTLCVRSRRLIGCCLPSQMPQRHFARAEKYCRSNLRYCHDRNLIPLASSDWQSVTSCIQGEPVRRYSRETSQRKLERKLEKLERRKKEKKEKKVIEIHEKMSILELSIALDMDLDGVYECLLMKTDVDDLKPTTVLKLETIKEVLKLLGMTYRFASLHKDDAKENKDTVRRPPPDPSQLKPRPPVVTVMGHVDHGKTTLLDSLRKTSVAAGEAGGITQHIGAFLVPLPMGQQITFLDTPGHAAFSSMRERGANVTDIVILVVAADDGVMDQTRESIKYAQNAGVPIIVAVNKCDKPGADPDFTKRDLLGHGIQLEEFGGDVQAVEISALKGTNLNALSESVVVLAELMELGGDPNGLVEATVIESRVDKGKGPIATAIIQRGTLKRGCILVSGTAQCRVRAMFNERGQQVQKAEPGIPVEVIGWKKVPSAGDLILEVESEKRAKEVVRWREETAKSKKLEVESVIIRGRAAEHQRAYKERKQANSLLHWKVLRAQRAAERLARPKENIKSDNPEVNLVIKGDVDGSVEAILDALATYDSQQQCKLEVLSYGVGIISDKDVELADTFSGIVIGFNVTASPEAEALAGDRGVPMKMHSVIYRMLDDIKDELSSKLPPKEEHDIQGEATVIQNFNISVGRRKVAVAGCRVNQGSLHANKMFKLLRNDDVIHQGSLASLKHLKDDVNTVQKGMECGVRFQQQVEFHAGDTIICYDIRHIQQTIDWQLGF
ncbi:translation initiation factor IF-2, mitochondrial-like [Acanthaster planci]|uniref:Translation initiation factor IF-2, mitochondrial n=1 Tax=Acanthaster planci TaxID=133434 RepID=A0A8B7ZIW0_ACAPL|nr:translation initiation factor IF-2, mitochondrial-like [Acanthaster planci]